MNYYMLGVIAGGVFAGFVFVLCKLLAQKTGAAATEYDERQKAILGDCYKIAFFSLMGFLAFFSFLELFEVTMFSMAQANFAAIVMAVGVFAVLAIKRDAYFGIDGEKRKRTLYIVGAMMAVINGIGGFRSILEGTFFVDGKFSTGFINVLVTILWVVIVVYAYFHKTKDEDEE